MAANTEQISHFIAKLWNNTQMGSVSWEPLINSRGFQARLGDFAIILTAPSDMQIAAFGGNPDEPDILIKRLDGRTVFSSQRTSALSSISQLIPSTPLSGQSLAVLRQIYRYLSARNTDIDELMKLL